MAAAPPGAEMDVCCAFAGRLAGVEGDGEGFEGRAPLTAVCIEGGAGRLDLS